MQILSWSASFLLLLSYIRLTSIRIRARGKMHFSSSKFGLVTNFILKVSPQTRCILKVNFDWLRTIVKTQNIFDGNRSHGMHIPLRRLTKQKWGEIPHFLLISSLREHKFCGNQFVAASSFNLLATRSRIKDVVENLDFENE